MVYVLSPRAAPGARFIRLRGQTVKRKLLIGLGAAVIVVIGIVFYAYCFACKMHAKAALADVTEAVSREFDAEGHLQNPRHAVDTCEWAEGHYPVGAVLPTWHPFAKGYQEAREAQIERVRARLVEDFGVDHGRDWARWKRCIFEPPPPRRR